MQEHKFPPIRYWLLPRSKDEIANGESELFAADAVSSDFFEKLTPSGCKRMWLESSLLEMVALNNKNIKLYEVFFLFIKMERTAGNIGNISIKTHIGSIYPSIFIYDPRVALISFCRTRKNTFESNISSAYVFYGFYLRFSALSGEWRCSKWKRQVTWFSAIYFH